MRATSLAILVLLLALLVGPASAALPDARVAAAGNVFAPAVVTVRAGEPVSWEGVLLTHTVTTAVSVVNAWQGQGNDRSNSDDDVDTFHAALPAGATLTHTFAEPGTYSYFCAFHARSGMVGTVVVTE